MTRNICAFVYFLEAIVNKSLRESQLSWISLKSQPWSFPPKCFIILLPLLHQSLSSLTFSIPSLLCSCLSTKRCQPLVKNFQVNQLWRLPEVSSLSEFLPKGDWLSGHVPSFHVLLDVKQQEVEAKRAFCWGCSARSWQSPLTMWSLHDNEFNPPGGPLQLEQVLDGHLCEGVRAVHLYVNVVVRKWTKLCILG